MASKFPQYTVEDLLDKTPEQFIWLVKQAFALDIDFANKVTAALGMNRAKSIAKNDRTTELIELKKLGFNVRRG